MKSRRRSEATTSLRYLMVACVQVGACDKVPRTFGHSVGSFNKIVVSSLVCVFVCALRFGPRTPPTRNRFRPL